MALLTQRWGEPRIPGLYELRIPPVDIRISARYARFGG
jgi:hypothetical protein